MNTKDVLKIAGAKPLATPPTATGKAGKGLVAEKGTGAGCGILEFSRPGVAGKNSFGIRNEAGTEGVGLGEGFWRGVFGSTA